MTYDPQKHHRRSIRLKGYDYSRAGLYFITICCKDRAHRFGHISKRLMALNDPGCMIWDWYRELESKFPHIQCHDMVVMPNHIHFIVELGAHPQNVRADLRVRPNDDGEHINSGEHTGSPLRVSLSTVVQWFKTMTTNAYIRGVKTLDWDPFNKKLWQRNYYEHIIRNQDSYDRIVEYIANNPSVWEQDKFHQN